MRRRREKSFCEIRNIYEKLINFRQNEKNSEIKPAPTLRGGRGKEEGGRAVIFGDSSMDEHCKFHAGKWVEPQKNLN